MGIFVDNRPVQTVKSFTANLAQAAGTYDLCVASGDVLIDLQKIALYMATAGATFTSVSVQTNQTAVITILSSVEGAVANLTAQKHVVRAIPTNPVLHLASGQKIQFTIVGSTGTGSMKIDLPYIALSANATLV